jgi:hypothetical protein
MQFRDCSARVVAAVPVLHRDARRNPKSLFLHDLAREA